MTTVIEKQNNTDDLISFYITCMYVSMDKKIEAFLEILLWQIYLTFLPVEILPLSRDTVFF